MTLTSAQRKHLRATPEWKEGTFQRKGILLGTLHTAEAPLMPSHDLLERRIRVWRLQGRKHVARRMVSDALAELNLAENPEEALVTAMGKLRLGTERRSFTKSGKKVQMPTPVSVKRQWGAALKLLRQVVVKEAHASHAPRHLLLAKELQALLRNQRCASATLAANQAKVRARALAHRKLVTN